MGGESDIALVNTAVGLLWVLLLGLCLVLLAQTLFNVSESQDAAPEAYTPGLLVFVVLTSFDVFAVTLFLIVLLGIVFKVNQECTVHIQIYHKLKFRLTMLYQELEEQGGHEQLEDDDVATALSDAKNSIDAIDSLIPLITAENVSSGGKLFGFRVDSAFV